jgi:hypothetical protein
MPPVPTAAWFRWNGNAEMKTKTPSWFWGIDVQAPDEIRLQG